MIHDAPRSLLALSLASASTPVLAQTGALSVAGLTPPPGVNPLLAWALVLLATAATGPATWLAWQAVKLASSLTEGALRAAAGWIRQYTRGTPSKLDDAAGDAVAKALEAQAARLKADADKAAPR